MNRIVRELVINKFSKGTGPIASRSVPFADRNLLFPEFQPPLVASVNDGLLGNVAAVLVHRHRDEVLYEELVHQDALVTLLALALRCSLPSPGSAG